MDPGIQTSDGTWWFLDAAKRDDDGGWSFGSPLVFWLVWLRVVLVAGAAAVVLGRLAGRGGGSGR